MQFNYSYVNTERSLHFNQIFVQHWESEVEHIFFDSDKILFSTPTPRKNLRLRIRLCNTGLNHTNAQPPFFGSVTNLSSDVRPQPYW